MKRGKRWMAALLSAVLLMSLLPAAALAADLLSDGTSVESTVDVTRAQLAEMIYGSEHLKTQIDLAGAGNAAPGFTDISGCTDQQQAAINALSKAQVMSGTGAATFDPSGTVTRGEAVVAIWRAAGSRSNKEPMTAGFTDLEPWYEAAVNCFYGAGVLQGTGEETFSGSSNIPVVGVNSFLAAYDANYDTFILTTQPGAVTRAEIAEQFYREFYPVLSSIQPVKQDMPFTDIAGCTDAQKAAIEFFYQREIISGASEDLFAPYAPVSNLQLATLLQRCATANGSGADGLGTLSLAGAFQFLLDNGADPTSVQAAGGNPNAPGLTADLVSWNNALKPEQPGFSPAGGTIEEGQTVTINIGGDAVIYCTTDGSDPTASSTRSEYTAPISITATTTIKAVAMKNNLYGPIASAEYVVDGGSGPVGGIGYPITIIGPTGELHDVDALVLDGNNQVYSIQGSTTTLYDPHDNADPDIRDHLATWIYNGWEFTAEKDGVTKTYGPTKYVDDGLRAFLNPLIAQGWTLTMNSRVCGSWIGYPITIIGPTGELHDVDALVLDSNNQVYSIQGSTTTLYDPHDNADPDIRDQLATWIYNGWEFTAEKDGVTKTYGPTKYVDDGLRAFLNPLIAQGWTLTMNSRVCGYYTHPDSGSSGSSGSSGGSGNKTDSSSNADGSTTTTVTSSNGTMTETTKWPDGSREIVETKKDGTVTTTTTDAAGNATKVVEHPDGSSQTTVDNADGSSSVTTVSENGQTSASVKLPAKVVEDAADRGEAVALPMPSVPVTADKDSAPTVTVDLPAGRSAKVEIPVENVTPGTVAVLVRADGTEAVLKSSLVTDNGVTATLSDGDTVKIVDNSKSFTDVSSSYWAVDAIAFATSHELFNGNTDTTFNPGGTTSRAMIWVVMARYEGADTAGTGAWYSAGQTWAVDNGISDGSDPNGTMTREQMAAMLYRYAQSKGAGFTGQWAYHLDYPDVDRVSGYAYEAMCWMNKTGVIGGTTQGTLDPQGPATRAQMAVILQRFLSAVDQ